jgi:hypothetical protein
MARAIEAEVIKADPVLPSGSAAAAFEGSDRAHSSKRFSPTADTIDPSGGRS